MESIVHEHVTIFLSDPHLQNHIQNKPKITCRRVLNLKQKIAPSKLKQKLTKVPCLIPLKGMYQCKTCTFVQQGKQNDVIKGKTYTIKYFFNCCTYHVICYRTIRPLRKRFGDHRRFIEKGNDEHSVPHHFLEVHNKSTKGLQVWIVEAMFRDLPEPELFHNSAKEKPFGYSPSIPSLPGG